MTLTVATTDDLTLCLALRRVVFIEEQGVPEAEEVDAHDQDAVHFLAVLNGRPVGTARLVAQGDTGKIGRVCVLREARGQGVGAALVQAAVAAATGRGFRQARLAAQLHAIPFYHTLGFAETGEVFLDAGTPHRDMIRAL